MASIAKDLLIQNRVLLWFMLAILLVVAGGAAVADDWPQWGGPQRDLVWRETGLVAKLPTDGLLPRVWSTTVGEGYSGPAVASKASSCSSELLLPLLPSTASIWFSNSTLD